LPPVAAETRYLLSMPIFFNAMNEVQTSHYKVRTTTSLVSTIDDNEIKMPLIVK
jgi:hypothetical protein